MGAAALKFLTSEWWSGCQTDDGGDAIRQFQAHLASIRGRLPAELLALQESISLHDARLESLVVSCGTQSASLRLQLATGRPLELRYAGVESFETVNMPDQALGGPGGYGDLGYDEADVLPGGLFEHRLLFSSSVEFRFRFRSLGLRPSSIAPHPPDPGRG